MGCDDCIKSIVDIGKTYLPPPVVLFVSHLLFATLCSILFFIGALSDEWDYCNKDGWMIYVQWGVGVILGLLITFIKYKEKQKVLSAILSFFAFWLTIFAIQITPIYCYLTSKDAIMFASIGRAVVNILLCIVYCSWCKSKIDKYWK